MALIHAFLVITLRANQIVSGLALTIFAGAGGLSSYLGNDLNLADQPATHSFAPFLPHSWQHGEGRRADPASTSRRSSTRRGCSWCSSALYLNRTRLGLNVRAVGESPAAADAMGINVTALPLRAHARRRRARGRRRRVLHALDHAAVGRRDHAGRGLDRDRARHLRVLAPGALPRRRLLLRRVLGHPVHLPGARHPERHPAGALPGAALRDDDRRARARLERRRAPAARRARRRSARRTCAKSAEAAIAEGNCPRYGFQPIWPSSPTTSAA